MLLRLRDEVYREYLKNPFFLEYAEKIKYLQYCPFFVGNQSLAEDIAAFVELRYFGREEILYQRGELPDCVYFVKEGVVLLERDFPLHNYALKHYELNYERNEYSRQETTLIVKKGMACGLDGILLKETLTPSSELNCYQSCDTETVLEHNGLVKKCTETLKESMKITQEPM